MSEINTKIHELHHVDMMAGREGWLSGFHPLAKVLVTVIYILTVVSFDKYDLAGLLPMAVYLIIVMCLHGLDFQRIWKKAGPLFLMVGLVGAVNPFLDTTPLFTMGRITVTGGVVSFATLALKGSYALCASAVLILSTSMEEICYALQVLHLPKELITVLLLIDRYVIVFMKEVERMSQAYSLRAPRQKGVHYKVWGSMLGQLLLRSMDRAENVYESMKLRGFQATFTLQGKNYGKISSVCFVVIWVLVFLCLRFGNIQVFIHLFSR